MTFNELGPDDRLALVALIKVVVLADGGVSEDEVAEIEDISEEFGEDEYRKLVDESDKRFKTEASLKKFLQTIENQDARELIYGVVLDAAMNEAIQGDEPALLQWLQKTWNVEVTFEGGPADGED